jgi:hypothetical protein
MFRAALLIVLASLIGCASMKSPSQADMNARVGPTFGGREALTYWVPASSPFYAAGRISRLAVDPSNASATLIKVFNASRESPMRLAVGGENSSLTRHEIIAALAQIKGDVSKLELSFFGDASDASEVRRVIEGRGGKYIAAK